MVINPPDERKNAITNLPRIGQPQSSTEQRAVFALPGQEKQPAITPEQILQKNVEKLVGQTFFGTLMKQMHESPFKSDLFSGGRGEKAFQPLFDSYMTERMTRGAGAKIVRPAVKRLQKNARAAYERHQTKGGAYVDNYR